MSRQFRDVGCLSQCCFGMGTGWGPGGGVRGVGPPQRKFRKKQTGRYRLYSHEKRFLGFDSKNLLVKTSDAEPQKIFFGGSWFHGPYYQVEKLATGTG